MKTSSKALQGIASRKERNACLLVLIVVGHLNPKKIDSYRRNSAACNGLPEDAKWTDIFKAHVEGWRRLVVKELCLSKDATWRNISKIVLAKGSKDKQAYEITCVIAVNVRVPSREGVPTTNAMTWKKILKHLKRCDVKIG